MGVSEPDYERLRFILEAEQKRPISIEEAREVGDELIEFYKLLAGDKIIVRGNLPRTPKATNDKLDSNSNNRDEIDKKKKD